MAAAAAIVLAALALVVLPIWVPRGGASAQCEPLFERYVALSLQDADAHLSRVDRDEKVAAARSAATASDALRECELQLTPSQATCAEAAPTVTAFERCFD